MSSNELMSQGDIFPEEEINQPQQEVVNMGLVSMTPGEVWGRFLNRTTGPKSAEKIKWQTISGPVQAWLGRPIPVEGQFVLLNPRIAQKIKEVEFNSDSSVYFGEPMIHSITAKVWPDELVVEDGPFPHIDPWDEFGGYESPDDPVDLFAVIHFQSGYKGEFLDWEKGKMISDIPLGGELKGTVFMSDYGIIDALTFGIDPADTEYFSAKKQGNTK